MRPTRILLLEADGPESGAIAATAAASGYQVHAATDLATQATYDANLQRLLSGYLLTDFSHPEQALDDIVSYVRRTSVEAVLTTNEFLTVLLAQACSELDLPGNDPSRGAVARNKAAMAEAFTRDAVNAPRTWTINVEDDLQELRETGQLTFPCVLKPADGAGSAGVTVMRTPADAGAAWRAVRQTRGMYAASPDPRVLVQEYVDGTEYSVESLTQGGAVTHLCITRKGVTKGAQRVETCHSLPVVLPFEIERAVFREVEKAIQAAGICNGASHTEVIIAPGGRCAVIEIAARIGAGQIGFLIQHALGINPWAALVDTALGQPADLTRAHHGHATVRFLTSEVAGRLLSVTGLPLVGPSVPSVRLRIAVGGAVNKTRSNRERLGSFIVTGPDAKRVEERADALQQHVRIEVEPLKLMHRNLTTSESDDDPFKSHVDHG